MRLIDNNDDSHFTANLIGIFFASDNLLVLLELVILFLDCDYVVVDRLFQDEELCGREAVAAAARRLRNTPVIGAHYV